MNKEESIMSIISQEFWNNGVSLTQKDNSLRVSYQGLLANSGAPEVYAHVGYGLDWQGTNDYKMHKTAHGFEVEIPWNPKDTSVNVCFKDTASNWDNNNGSNYSITPHHTR